MPGIENNLYPPVTETYMPAFVRTSACRVYFSLSVYNNVEEIKNVQVIINNQNTNISALDSKLYPAGIKITNLQIDYGVLGDNKYFITITPEDLQGKEFELNQFYKVQIRFTSTRAETLTDKDKIAGWLINNQKHFSEWSRVCLIKGIEKPEIYLKGFESIESEDTLAVFTSEVVDFVGRLYYQENEGIEKEYLKSYDIRIYRLPENRLIYDSGEIFTNIYNPNEINYTLKTALEDGTNYKVIFSYRTVNEYLDKVSFMFTIVQNTIDILNATITAEIEKEIGRTKVNIKSNISEIFFGNITIRRTSSKSNFTIWEDIHEVSIAEGKVLNYTWYDYTIESGIWYRYCAQQRNSKGDRGAVINIRYPIMEIFDDMFLTRNGMQLRLRYDPNISSFKRTLLESRVETLGSKYPFIRRNGNVEYRQFPISGLITAYCDEEGIFINRENVFGENEVLYEEYNDKNNIIQHRDFIYEREFRERVMDFLYANTIKLFRSTTEGNILVKLMDISFTPNQTLGRMLYSFSATAYEIDDFTLANCDKYGIQNIGKLDKYLRSDFYFIGQLQGTYEGEKEDILTVLREKYSQNATDKYVNTVNYLKWIRIEFEMPPYLIKTSADGSIIPLPDGEPATEDTVSGYIVYINNKPIIVSARNFYELIDSDTMITSVYFPIASQVYINYQVAVDQTENKKLLFSKMYFYTKAGQISDTFDIEENVFLRIYNKYTETYDTFKTQFLSLNEIAIEATPGTIAYIRDSFDDDFFKHEIGETGVLKLYDKDTTINGLYFSGIRLNPGEAETDILRDNEYLENNESFNSLEDIKNPKKNNVYRVDGKKYIYYEEKWFEFSHGVVQCPVYALIDYVYESMKGEY